MAGVTARAEAGGEPRVRGSLRRLDGARIEVQQAAVRSLESEAADLEQSAVLSARARRISVRRSSVALLAGRQVIARNVTTAVLIAPTFRGNVRTLIDWRTALAFGAGIALGHRLLRLLRL